MGTWTADHIQWNSTNTKKVLDIDDEIRSLSSDLGTRLDGLMDFSSSTGEITQLLEGAHKNYRGTKAELETADAVIPEGVLALETDTHAFKIGDGTTSYASLEYFQINYDIERKVGEIFFDAAPYERPGCVWTDYRLLSQSAYAELFALIGHLYSKSAADATVAESAGKFHVPDGMFLFPRGGRTYQIDETAMPAGIVLTITGHGFATDGADDGRPIKFLRRTPSASPTIDSSVTEYTQYYIAVQDANTVRLYTTESDAVTDDGSTNVITFAGDGSGDIYASTMGCYQADQMQGHKHGLNGSTDAAVESVYNRVRNDGFGTPGTSGTLEPITDGTNGTPRTGAETRGAYASFGMQIKVVGTSTTGEPHDTLMFDTEWIANSDWTDAEFTVTHNLNANLAGLIVKFLISTDGTDANSFEAFPNDRATDQNLGMTAFQVGVDTLKFNTGSSGVSYILADGSSGLLTTQSYYYRVVVYKPDLISTAVYGTIRTVTDGNWTLQTQDAKEFVYETGASDRTFSIPDGFSPGTEITVRKADDGAGKVTISTNTDTITRAGLSSVTLTSDGDFWTLRKISSTRWELVDGFESGGSSGFSWKKSNDGTLVNSFVSPSAATVNITTSLDGHYYYQDSYNFSKSFVDTNYTFLGSANVGGRISHITAGGTKTTSAVSYFVVNGTSLSGVSLTISLRAEGRWYA